MNDSMFSLHVCLRYPRGVMPEHTDIYFMQAGVVIKVQNALAEDS
jgi:hypothetical protein